MNHPKFVVVGHPNKGKSSLVSTLCLNDTVAISDTPGTTKEVREFVLKVDGKIYYELIDTPGFQRARRVLEFLKKKEVGARERPNRLKEFIKTHCDGKSFKDECELLKPIVDGAGIIYVVDASKPYSDEYEAQMEILRYAGSASIAILNYIGGEDYTPEWDSVLGQYFRLVKKFNPLKASEEEHLDLIDALSHLNPLWSKDLKEVKTLIEKFYKKRDEKLASVITKALKDAVSLKKSKSGSSIRVQNDLKSGFANSLRDIEKKMQRDILKSLNFKNLKVDIVDKDLEYDLLSKKSQEIFGLKKEKLVLISTISTATAGGVIDLLAGGHSFFLGSLIGGAIGFASAMQGYDEISKIKLISSEKIEIGPIKNPNFGFVFLSRAILFAKTLLNTTHANKNSVMIDFNSDEFSLKELKEISKLHEKFRLQKDSEDDLKSYEKLVLRMLHD